MSYKSYETKSLTLSSLIKKKIDVDFYNQREGIENYVNSTCLERGWFVRNIESFDAYSCTVNLLNDYTEEEKEMIKTAVLFILFKWFTLHGVDLI